MALLVVLSAGIAAAMALAGCQTACQGDGDCVGAGFCDQASGRCQRDCFTDDDCRSPPACRDNPTACAPLGQFCSGAGRCRGPIALDLDVPEASAGSDRPPPVSGWNDPPGSGRAFIIRSLVLAGRDVGFDLDGRCDETGCIDNQLWPVASIANNDIRQGLAGGETLILVELAGLHEDPYTGFDEALTTKIYGAIDADEPVFIGNNFGSVLGSGECCRFRIGARSLVGLPPRARTQALAALAKGRMSSIGATELDLDLSFGREPRAIRLERVLLSGQLSQGLTRIEGGLLAGAVTVSDLHAIDNPYCKSPDVLCPAVLGSDSTLLDLVAAVIGPAPAIDLDGDGTECVFDIDGDGRVDRCCDGAGPGRSCDIDDFSCPGRQVPPTLPGDPSSCALSPRMRDGYALTLAFDAVRATIVGSAR